MSEVKRLNFTVSQFESVVPYASEHGQYVRYADYAKLEAGAQALREEVAALRARVVVVPERKPVAASREFANRGWNLCLDELARLNGKVVSEGLLRRIAQDSAGYDQNHWEAVKELRALLDEGEEVSDGL